MSMDWPYDGPSQDYPMTRRRFVIKCVDCDAAIETDVGEDCTYWMMNHNCAEWRASLKPTGETT